MSQAKRDANHIPTLIGVSYLDGVTPVPLRTDPITGRLLILVVDTDSTVPVLRDSARKDENHVSTMLGYNSTTTQALITHNGYLAIQTN